jgi:formylglycine-generating enzyme required for sulfatase activity
MMRCGIFMANANNTGRITAGASYYGILELSGNLWERSVTIGNTTGRAFTGLHGDGELDLNGNAVVANWPGTNASGAGFRGGGWNKGCSIARVSDRYDAASPHTTRYYNRGLRCVRTSP